MPQKKRSWPPQKRLYRSDFGRYGAKVWRGNSSESLETHPSSTNRSRKIVQDVTISHVHNVIFKVNQNESHAKISQHKMILVQKLV